MERSEPIGVVRDINIGVVSKYALDADCIQSRNGYVERTEAIIVRDVWVGVSY
jgi:hypothetical protein